jgi:hypothetical protein
MRDSLASPRVAFDDYPDLAALGVKTVIDLTRDGRDDEKGLVEAAGMKFVRIPLTTTEAPARWPSRSFSRWSTIRRISRSTSTARGRHRTGTMTAIYRMTRDGWTPARV